MQEDVSAIVFICKMRAPVVLQDLSALVRGNSTSATFVFSMCLCPIKLSPDLIEVKSLH